jgi:hypothetical protein
MGGSAGKTKYVTDPLIREPASQNLQDFERKSALFSLASSEILIVNLWEHQVGLYQGANMGLLKTVFEVNLGLFGKKAKDGYVALNSSFEPRLIILFLAQVDELSSSSSFETTSDKLL